VLRKPWPFVSPPRRGTNDEVEDPPVGNLILSLSLIWSSGFFNTPVSGGKRHHTGLKTRGTTLEMGYEMAC